MSAISFAMCGRCASKPGDAEIAGGEESEPASVPAGERGDTMDGRVKRREPEHTPKTHHVLSPSINAGASTVLWQSAREEYHSKGRATRAAASRERPASVFVRLLVCSPCSAQ